MKEKQTGTTASIRNGVHCRDCGWPIVDACCNCEFSGFKDSSQWDWWFYCSNKGCKNHEGEGVFQDRPDWIENDTPNNCFNLNDAG